MIQLMNKRLLIKENGAIGLANITMTHLTIAHFSKGKNISSCDFITEDVRN